MYGPMPCEAPVRMALRASITHTPFSRSPRQSESKIILLIDNLQERQLLSKKRTERVGQLLVVAAGAAQTLATERLEPLGLSPRAWGVLSTLVESGPLTQIELATATATDRTAMVYLLDELERQGLVERMPNPGDRRSYLIHLTRQGRPRTRSAAPPASYGGGSFQPPHVSPVLDCRARIARRVALRTSRSSSSRSVAAMR